VFGTGVQGCRGKANPATEVGLLDFRRLSASKSETSDVDGVATGHRLFGGSEYLVDV
jgi:hypothetical protein